MLKTRWHRMPDILIYRFKYECFVQHQSCYTLSISGGVKRGLSSPTRYKWSRALVIFAEKLRQRNIEMILLTLIIMF